jgi:hypothetical protein
LTEELIETSQEEIRELSGEYVPDGSQVVRVFTQVEDVSAYTSLMSFISWVRPKSMQMRSGVDQHGNEAIELIYLRGK